MKYAKLFGLEHISVPRSPNGLKFAGLDVTSTVQYSGRGRLEAVIDEVTKYMALLVTSSAGTSKTGGGFIRLGSLCDDLDVSELTFGFRFKQGIRTQPANHTFVSLCLSNVTTANVDVTPNVYIPQLRSPGTNQQPAEGYYELTFTFYSAASGQDGKLECFFEGALVFTAALPNASWNMSSYKNKFIFLGSHSGSIASITSSVVGSGAVDDAMCYFADLYAQADDTLRDGSTRFGPVYLKRLPAKSDSVIPWDSLNGTDPVVTDKPTSLNQNVLNTTFTPHFKSDAAKSAVRIKPDVSNIVTNSTIRAVSGEHSSYLPTAEAVDMKAQWSYNSTLGDVRTDRPPLNSSWTVQTSFKLPVLRRLPGDQPITKANLANLELVLTPLAV